MSNFTTQFQLPIYFFSVDDQMHNMARDDIDKLFYSFVLMFIYANFTLGNLNKVESRFIVSIAGLMSILMGLVVGNAICHILKQPFYSTHQIAFVICLGKKLYKKLY